MNYGFTKYYRLDFKDFWPRDSFLHKGRMVRASSDEGLQIFIQRCTRKTSKKARRSR